MAFIGFGKIDTNLIPLLSGCIFCVLNRILNQYKGTKLFENIALTNVFIAFGDILIIIPYIIYQIRARKNTNPDKKDDEKHNVQENNSDTKKFEYIYEESEDIENVKGKGKFIILIALIFFVNYNMFVYTFDVKSNTWIMYILFTSIFYYIILKSKLYLHHYLSICSILIFGIIIDLILENLQIDFSKQIIKITLSVFRVILLSFDYVIIKYTMEKKYVSPYIIGMYNGLINLVLFIIFGIFDYYFFHINEYDEYFSNFNKTELLVIFGLISTQLGLYTSLFFIDKNDSPCHIFIVFVFGQFGNYFYYFKFEKYSVIVIICLVLILFFSLVFNEIIELRFCGLSFNTKRNITKRAETEVGDSMMLMADCEEKDENINEPSNKSVEDN